MKKPALLFALLIFLLLPSIPLIAYAHPGRTDGSGGHTDHSTGEYHYHHGYPAHDHYDMDGDGDIDCPYNFDDQTNHSSGGRTEITPGRGDAIKPGTQEGDPKPNKLSFADIILKIFEYLLLAVVTWLSSSYFLSYIFMLIFGEDRGCSMSMITGAVISIIVTILIIIK